MPDSVSHSLSAVSPRLSLSSGICSTSRMPAARAVHHMPVNCDLSLRGTGRFALVGL
jgi:hypothetical protein